MRDLDVRVERIADPRNLNRVAAKGMGKSGGTSGTVTNSHTPHEYPNTLRSRSSVRFVEAVSEGPVYGPVASTTIWEAVFLDETQLASNVSSVNFAFTNGEFRYGWPGQAHIPGFPIAEAAHGVGTTTQYLVPIVRACTTPPLDAIRYILRIPALYTNEDDGDVVGASVAYAFDIRANGGTWTNVVTERIYGKTMSPYERAVRVQLPTPNPTTLEIRITRLDPDPPTTTAAQLIWGSFVEIIDGYLGYDSTCCWSLTLDAETFPSIPSRGYLMDGLMVDLPTNYEPRSHSYAGDWNGAFYTQWTCNPAWVLYALLVNERWGLGRFLDTAAIDKWSFYEAGVWNDQGVPDGRGGYDYRWTCNCVINTRQDAFTVLSGVASSMLAALYFSNGTIFLAQDRRLLTPARLFSNADVVDGLFDYAGTDYRGRWTAVAVTWNDPSDNYQQAVELVIDPELVAKQGYRETSHQAFGCTTQGQAQRVGRWLLYTSQFETEVVTFKTGLENADLRPGEMIAISDPSHAGTRLGGRLLADDGVDTITLDDMPAELASNPAAFSIYVTLRSAAEAEDPAVIGLSVPYQLVPGNQLRVGGKPASIPEGSMWLARSLQVEPTLWRVQAVYDRGQTIYEITATEYHQEKWTYIDTGTRIAPPPTTLIPTGPLLGPSDIKHREYIYLDSTGFPQFAVIISWSASPDARVSRYQLELSGPGGDYRPFNQVVGISVEALAMREGPWIAYLVAFDNLGRRSQRLIYNFTPVGRTEKPKPPLALYLTPQDRTTNLIWVPTGEIDVVSYWIKWAPQTDGSATWERATTSINRVNRNTTQHTTPTRYGTFMIKTVDALGQESVDWAEAILTEQITDDVFQETFIEPPDWPGVRGPLWHHTAAELWLKPPTAPEVVPPELFPGDRNLALNSSPTRAEVYSFEQTMDLGLPCAVSMLAIVDVYGDIMGKFIADWQPDMAWATPMARGAGYMRMAAWVPIAMAVPLAMGTSGATGGGGNYEAHIEVRVSQDGATYGAWSPLKSALMTGQAFQWRLIGSLYDLVTTLRVARCEVRIEIPLRSESGSDVALGAVTGHLSVVYPVGFLDTPTVQLTARQSIAPDANIVITASDRDHFEVQHRRNATGAAVPGGSIDYFVQGFGGHA